MAGSIWPEAKRTFPVRAMPPRPRFASLGAESGETGHEQIPQSFSSHPRRFWRKNLPACAREKVPARCRRPLCAKSIVTIATDADLQAFARKVLEACRGDPEIPRRAIEHGRLVFRLAGGTGPTRQNAIPARAFVARRCELRSHRNRDSYRNGRSTCLPKDTKTAAGSSSARRVRLTPLARDRLRHRGICD